jgi:parallel beta helix pectate lyase-like protein
MILRGQIWSTHKSDVVGLTLHTVNVQNNASTSRFAIQANGGGLANSGTATLTHCLFARNSASSGDGGGLANTGTVTIHRCTFTHNGVGEFDGGGISNGGVLLLTDSTLIDNTSGEFGGGLANSGTVVVSNSTIARNGLAAITGGGLANFLGGTVTLLNSTIAENESRVAGGVANILIGGGTPGTVVLLNTLLAGNQAGEELDCGAGPITSLGHNLIGDPRGCTITLQPSDLTGDPGLDAFTDNGRPGNGHFPLLPTSQAIDAGNDAVCPRTDQLGRLRIGPCDIGAIEFPGKGDRQHDEEDDQPNE